MGIRPFRLPHWAPFTKPDPYRRALNVIFDADWYRKKYAGQFTGDPLANYLSKGVAAGRQPSPLFDIEFYQKNNPERDLASQDPFRHFLERGNALGLDPHPLFDTSWYLERNEDVANSGMNALVHYVQFGDRESRNPHPLFSTGWYVSASNCPEGKALFHYITTGGYQGIDPHPTFMAAAYLGANPHLRNRDIVPLSSYVQQDPLLAGPPNSFFDVAWYLNQYPDVRASGLHPFVDFVSNGVTAKRNPSTMFDTDFYVTAYPDVLMAGIEPLGHFLRYGAAEGRLPRRSANTGSGSPARSRPSRPPSEPARVSEEFSYADWRKTFVAGEAQFALQRRQIQAFESRPTISIIVPVYKVAVGLMAALVESILEQTYPDWELCLALAYHDDPLLTRYLTDAASSDPRIKLKVLEENGGISRNSNAALELATGVYVALLDHDDTIAPNALFEAAKLINEDPSVDFIYTDKDTMNESGTVHFNPLFKPKWSPEWMLSVNYLTHLNVMRTTRVREIGGWDPDTDGAQDWDIFLRFIGREQKVRSIPKPLYHWRLIPTSVASGLSAKPWAAAAQLRAVTNYVCRSGWPDAKAAFLSESFIHIEWSPSFRPRTLVAVLGEGSEPSGPGWDVVSREIGNAGDLPGNNVSCCWISMGAADANSRIDRAISASGADLLVFVDSGCTPQDGWFAELTGPLENPDIGCVGGRIETTDHRVLEGGWVFPNARAVRLFRGEFDNFWGVFGGSAGYRNHVAVSGTLLAMRTSGWKAVGGFSSQPSWGRRDLDLCLKLQIQGLGRIMLNAFARAVGDDNPVFGRGERLQEISATFLQHFPDGDPFFHHALAISGEGRPVLRAPAVIEHGNLTAEAQYSAAQYDAPAKAFVAAMPQASGPREIRSVAWFLPGFEMPFYGGIMTILRAAKFLMENHGVHSTFVILSSDNPEVMRVRIGRAFPRLAAASDVICIQNVEKPLALAVDAAVATLWVTAYAVRRLDVPHKFYFVQDYEPLFYPAGTLYSLAEATYKFGFQGICNTQSLRELYEGHGGKAIHFLPAIDPKVFHDKGRVARRRDDAFLIFSYARPGHPRNCFEVISEGFVEIKKRLGERIRIITAGAEWDPREYRLNGVVEHLGLLSYEDTGRLYRSVDAGLVAMATSHPSYLPFELMACGAVVFTNRNRATTWFLKDDENCVLFDLTRSAIADVLEEAIADHQRLDRIAARASSIIAADFSDWNRSMSTIAGAMLGGSR